LRHIPDEKRAEASLQSLAKAIATENVDMSLVQEQIKNKEPSNRSKPVFGNENFAREILKKEGWLAGTRSAKEPALTGPCKKEKAPV
jgi:hypothetical protein